MIGEIKGVFSVLRWTLDGKIQQSFDGKTFKPWKKVKEGVDPKGHYEKTLRRIEENKVKYPFQWEYEKALKEITGSFETRVEINTLIDLMPDPDGVWSMLDDEGYSFAIEDLCGLCEKYKLAKGEKKDVDKGQALG